jgi:hypothetical protein
MKKIFAPLLLVLGTLVIWLQVDVSARQSFAALCGGGPSCSFITGDVWQAADEAEKTRQNFNYFNNIINSAEDCDNPTTDKLLWDSAAKNFSCGTDGGGGSVTGPGSSTDNAIVRWNGTGGTSIQDSGVTIADGTTLALSGSLTLSGSNTGDVTLAGTPNYITISSQVITRALINLASHVTGDLPYANLTQASGASKLLGRGSSSGGGDWEEITLGSGLAMSGNTLTSSGGGGGGAPDNALYVTLSTDATLVNERVATQGGNIELSDGGAGGNLTIKAPNIIGITVDGGGSTITTGTKGFVVARGTCTIDQATLLSTDASSTSGSIVMDVWKDTYANYPPTNADSITASAKPTLSSANKSQDSTLTGWTTSVTAGDIIGFEVESATTVTKVDLALRCR